MVRRVLSLALVLQLLLPAHAVRSLLAAVNAAPASEAAATVCSCTGKAPCKCCGCEEPPPPAKPDADPGPHGSLHCSCTIAEQLAPASIYLPGSELRARVLCAPPHESLHMPPAVGPSVSLPIDSPPPKDQA